LQIDDISKGSSAELEIRLNGRPMNFKSEIVLIKENSILITSIKVNDQTIGFSDQYQINFLYSADNHLYIWENVTVKLVKYNGSIYHKIDIFGEGKSYNRRASYRLYIGEEMPLYINTANGPSAVTVLLKDISETGAGFIMKDDIDISRSVRLKLKDNSQIINLPGTIVRKEYLSNLNSFLYGCRFTEKSQSLGKYIARRQYELLKIKTTSILSKKNIISTNRH
jgi:c-di-GMP-binding flagellar brake protein YcgR